MSGWPRVREKSVKFYFSSRSGKSQEILQNGQGNLIQKKFSEKSGNFIILGQNCLAVTNILFINLVIFFFSLALLAWHDYKLMFILETVCPKT